VDSFLYNPEEKGDLTQYQKSAKKTCLLPLEGKKKFTPREMRGEVLPFFVFFFVF